MESQRRSLYGRLKQLADSDYYPFHMPGHKRNMAGRPMEELYRLDITEIDGFDNLHDADGLLADIMTHASEFYGCRESFLLVNGSSCGVLSALLSAVPEGGRVLMARNSHKSAYHAVYLGRMRASYLYPESVPGYGLTGGIRPQDVAEALERERDIDAVFLTSPTYDGVICDLRAVADIVHSHGLPFIVDEAHGAHLALFEDYRTSSAAACGADLIVHSIHKTLPSPTQTAFLHLNGPYADSAGVRRYLRMLQSSSPSYLLMAGAGECLRILEEEGERLAGEYAERLKRFRQRTDRLLNLEVPGRETDFVRAKRYGIYDMDDGKLPVFSKNWIISGKTLYEELRMKYHLQMEMCAGRYALAMTSIMDTEEGFERLARALEQMDRELSRGEFRADGGPDGTAGCPGGEKAVMTVYEAQNAEAESVPFREGAGRVSAEYISLYPPGIPIIVPGEVFTADILDYIADALEQGLTVQGCQACGKELSVVKGNRLLP